MRCDHEHDDGAYVIGALSPAERAAYERHLSTCSFCREAVADMAVLPGLLGRLDPDDFARLLEPDLPIPPKQRNRMPDLVTAAQVDRRRQRRSGRLRATGTALAAACLALVIGAGGALIWRDNAGKSGTSTPGPMMAMHAVAGPVPVSAEVNLANTAWGTQITMKCSYANTGSSKQYTFKLMAYGPDDSSEQISSWVAIPGRDVQLTATTRYSGSELSKLELVRYDNTAVLAYDVP